MKDNPDHQICQSLLQKAVRRGCVDLIPRIIDHLVSAGQLSWLQQRTAVITFEECWPLGVQLIPEPNPAEITGILSRVAASVKFKDATGLGSLAYHLSLGDSSVLSGYPDDDPIRDVMKAIQDPPTFWEWCRKSVDPFRQQLVDNARYAFSEDGTPWDQAFKLAAGYLAVTSEIPETNENSAHICLEDGFPFWIAIDKHTDLGRSILKTVASNLAMDPVVLGELFFYFAGVSENELTPSFWWQRELDWRFKRLGMIPTEAEKTWQNAAPVLHEALLKIEADLKAHIHQH